MRRGVAVFIGFVVMSFGVVLATVAFGGGGPSADVGRLVCADGGARVVTAKVTAQANGVHLQIANVGMGRRYEVVSVADPGNPATGGVLPADGVLDLVLTLPPGEAEFRCVHGDAEEPLRVRFEVRDPAGAWVPASLWCSEAASGVFETRYADEPFQETARRAVPGLRRSDRLDEPGYPETAWHGELHVVIRGERVEGRIVRVLNHGTWNVSVDACPGSGLTSGAVVETGAT